LNPDLLAQLADFQKLQQQMEQKLEGLRVEASAGGGMVRVVADGTMRVVSVTIDPSVVNPAETAMLQDLIVAAVNEARTRAADAARREFTDFARLLSLPGLAGLSRTPES
jgi:DNA-binding YbaB/EbfC family protein